MCVVEADDCVTKTISKTFEKESKACARFIIFARKMASNVSKYLDNKCCVCVYQLGDLQLQFAIKGIMTRCRPSRQCRCSMCGTKSAGNSAWKGQARFVFGAGSMRERVFLDHSDLLQHGRRFYALRYKNSRPEISETPSHWWSIE